jgi:LmbE family N-acetylglucosaminyl deacetylase
LSHADPSIGCIFAHPDDETFCVGGIVAKYAAAGHEVHLWCATDGDAGKNAGVPVSSREELAALRRRELADAARILGISSVELGHYRDGELARTDPTSLVADIVGFIRRRRPTVILTFGPEGAPTGHADHAATSRVATAAFFLSGLATSHPDQNLPPHRAARLYFHAWDFPLAEKRLKLESVPGVGTARIDVRAFKEKKSAAFAAHATQQGSSGVFFSSAFPDVEVLAFAAGVPQPAPIVDDVFAGLSGLDD